MRFGHWTAGAAALVSVLFFIAAAHLVDLREIPSALAAFPVNALLISALALLLSAVVAGFRLRSIAAHMGHRLTAVESLQAMAAGQIAGSLSIQFFGHIAARTALLRSRGVNMPANIVLASYERLIAFAVSIGLALIGAFVLFGAVDLQLDKGGKELLHILVGIIAAIVGAALIGWKTDALRIIRDHASWDFVRAVLKSAGYTVVIQLATAVAYVAAAKSVAPQVELLRLLAASFVIMFAASLPISFAGWGVRELSAVFVLNAVGVEATTAIAIAVLIGVLALGAVVVIGAATSLAGIRGSVKTVVAAPRGELPDLTHALGWILPLMIGTVIVLQIKAPTSSGFLTINPADPLAVIGAAVFLYWVRGNGWPQWRVARLGLYVGLLTAVLLLSFALGVARFGLTDWAYYNRTIGWFVLLGYAMSGALIVAVGGERGQQLLLRTFIGAVLGLVLMDYAGLALLRAGVVLLPDTFSFIQFDGLSGNRNAFAFQIIIAIACLAAAGLRHVALATLLMGLWFTGSLAGLGAGLVVLVAMLLLRTISPKELGFATAVFFGFLSLLVAITLVVKVGSMWASGSIVGAISGAIGAAGNMTVLAGVSDSSMTERWASLVGGWELFTAHPIFGSGLGAFMESQMRASGPLVIHSTPLWILAEMGIVGFAVFALFGFRLAQAAWLAKDAAGTALLLVLLGFCAMAAPHDMMFQRSVWLIAGALVVNAAGISLRDGSRRSETSA